MEPLIIYIDCAVQFTSVALARGNSLLNLKESDRINSAAEELHVFIMNAINESGVKRSELKAVCISGGPGSYTGLRIATSAAKGLCFALDIPLLQVNTLEMMVYGAIQRYGMRSFTSYVPMIDARRMEVFSAKYQVTEGSVVPVSHPGPVIVSEESLVPFIDPGGTLIFGNGAFKCLPMIHSEAVSVFETFKTSAADLIIPCQALWSAGQFEDTAYFEPNYLKAFHFK